jgi:hypothetical protein
LSLLVGEVKTVGGNSALIITVEVSNLDVSESIVPSSDEVVNSTGMDIFSRLRSEDLTDVRVVTSENGLELSDELSTSRSGLGSSDQSISVVISVSLEVGEGIIFVVKSIQKGMEEPRSLIIEVLNRSSDITNLVEQIAANFVGEVGFDGVTKRTGQIKVTEVSSGISWESRWVSREQGIGSGILKTSSKRIQNLNVTVGISYRVESIDGVLLGSGVIDVRVSENIFSALFIPVFTVGVNLTIVSVSRSRRSSERMDWVSVGVHGTSRSIFLRSKSVV